MPRLKLTFDPDPLLRKKNQDVVLPADAKIRQLIDQMKFACKKFKGIGLAAPQIGRNLNLAIINLEPYDLPPFSIINPRILKTSSQTENVEEGCLSIPNLFGLISRPAEIKVEFYNEDNKKIVMDLDGLAARVFQHEIDHLNQTLIKDKWDQNTVHKVDEAWKKANRARRKV
ncbi:MAG: peptide deformylase [Patescibacteria group bacterium]|nr:peptide deformylase [Patescibacteria group bacterium]